TVLTDEQQTLMRAIGITGMAAHRARLARVVGVYLDRHRPVQEGFIGNHPVQFGKGPFGIGSVRLSLLFARPFAMLAPSALTDVCQVLQSNQRMGISRDDAFGDRVIGILLQPSLSPTQHDGSSCGGASAFLLQTLPQSRIMVGFRNLAFPRMKGMSSSGGSGDCQVAHPYIHPCHTGMRFRSRICYLKFQGYQQVELLAWLVIPEPGCSNYCPL